MSNELQTVEKKSILNSMADKFGMASDVFSSTVRHTIMPKGKHDAITVEEFAAFLLIAKTYNLNPLTKEIYAFPAKGGGISTVVSIDGWLRIINERPELDGIEFVDNMHDGKVISITCRITRKDRDRPIEVTEYLDECKRNSEPWQKWPMRMLRHKALIQCARYAFGFSGIVDPDEGERIKEVDVTKSAKVTAVEDKIANLAATLNAE